MTIQRSMKIRENANRGICPHTFTIVGRVQAGVVWIDVEKDGRAFCEDTRPQEALELVGYFTIEKASLKRLRATIEQVAIETALSLEPRA